MSDERPEGLSHVDSAWSVLLALPTGGLGVNWHADVQRAICILRDAGALDRAREQSTALARLREERDRLRTALVSVTEYMDRAGGDNCGMSECPWCKQQSLDQPYEHSGDCELELARAALSSPSESENTNR